MFKGSIVALVTPFENGKVDEKKLRELVEFQIENGTSGIVPCGTTGESPTLDNDEHDSPNHRRRKNHRGACIEIRDTRMQDYQCSYKAYDKCERSVKAKRLAQKEHGGDGSK